MSDQSLGQFIRNRRKRLGLTQERLAEKCGLTHGSIARFETGSHRPDLNSMILLAEALGVPLDELARMEG